jgi:hypothetical protein
VQLFLRWVLSAILIFNSLPSPILAEGNPVVQSAEQAAGAKLPFKAEHHTDKWISTMVTSAFIALLGSSWMKYKIGDLVADFWIAVIGTGILVVGDLISNELWMSDMSQVQNAALGSASNSILDSTPVDGQQQTREAQINSYRATQAMLGVRLIFYGAASLAFALAAVVTLGNAFAHTTETDKLKAEAEQVLKKDIPANAKAKVQQECASKSAGNAQATQACTQAIMSAEVDPCIKTIEKFYAGYLKFVDQWKNEEKISTIRCKEMETWKKMQHALFKQCKERMRDFQNANKIDLNSEKHMNTTEGLFMCLAQESAEKEEQKEKELQEQFEKEFDPSEVKEGPKGDGIIPKEQTEKQVSIPSWHELLMPVAYAQNPSNFSGDWLNGMIAGEKGPSTFIGVGMGVAGVAFFTYFNEKAGPMLDEFWSSPILRAVIYGAGSILLIVAMSIQSSTIMEMNSNIERLQGTVFNAPIKSEEGQDELNWRMSATESSLAQKLENINLKRPVTIACPKNDCQQLTAQKIFKNPSQQPPAGLVGVFDSLIKIAKGFSGKSKLDTNSLMEMESLASRRSAITKDINLFRGQILSKHPSLNAQMIAKKEEGFLTRFKNLVKEVMQNQGLTSSSDLFAAVNVRPSEDSNPAINDFPQPDQFEDSKNSTGGQPLQDDESTGGLSMGTTGGVEVAGSDMSEYERELKQVANSEGFDYASAAKEQDDIHPVAQDGLFDLISRRYQRSHLFKNLE